MKTSPARSTYATSVHTTEDAAFDVDRPRDIHAGRVGGVPRDRRAVADPGEETEAGTCSMLPALYIHAGD